MIRPGRRAGLATGGLIIAAVVLVLGGVLLGNAHNALGAERAWRRAGSSGKVVFVLVSAVSVRDRAVYQAAVDSICAPGVWCKVMFWSDPRHVPERLPMTAAQADAWIADFVFNPNTRYRHLRVRCSIDRSADCF